MNDINFLLKTIQRLRKSKIEVLLFGGWAEELLQIVQPREHRDIDLLYVSKNFDQLEKFMIENKDVKEIPGKRFPHKRAFLLDGVMVEFFLVKKKAGGYITNFFGSYRHKWPTDLVNKSVQLEGEQINIASQETLDVYRKSYLAIKKARNESIGRSKNIS